MARSFGNESGNHLARGTSVFNPADPRPCSVSIWFRANTQGAYYHPFSNNYPTEPIFSFEAPNGGGSNNQMSIYSTGVRAFSSTFALSTTDWTHLGVSWDTDNAVAFYLNGSAHGTDTLVLGGGTPTDGAVIGAVEHSSGGFWDIDGDVAEFAGWETILTSGEFAELYARISPTRIQPASLVSYAQIYGVDSPEPDLVSADWNIHGSLPQAAHPFTRALVPPALVHKQSMQVLLGR